MKFLIALCLIFAFVMPTHAHLFKKLKDKVNNSIDKKVDKAVGPVKGPTTIEQKEDAASDQYSDATENNERPIFVDIAAANGKMILKLKKGC